MKMVNSFKGAIYSSVVGIVIFSILSLILTYSMISSFINNAIPFAILQLFVLICFFAPFLFLCLFALNRGACKIYYDPENNLILRKGYIRGYNYKLKIEDIQNIICAPFNRETTYYVLIDPYNKRYEGGTKESFIRIEKTKQNLEFIRQFWDKPIKEYKDYDWINNL